jgi:hypothetical protein
MNGELLVALCKRRAPICPKCGKLLHVTVDGRDQLRGRCTNRLKPGVWCRQHFAVVGFFDGPCVLVIALTPDEARRYDHGMATAPEHAEVATCRAG